MVCRDINFVFNTYAVLIDTQHLQMIQIKPTINCPQYFACLDVVGWIGSNLVDISYQEKFKYRVLFIEIVCIMSGPTKSGSSSLDVAASKQVL